ARGDPLRRDDAQSRQRHRGRARRRARRVRTPPAPMARPLMVRSRQAVTARPAEVRVPGDLLVHLRRARDHADRSYAEPLCLEESKAFYTDVLGFEARDDITLGDGYRWCTVVHPNQPELMVSLAVPGPPQAPELVEAMKRAQDEGGMAGLGLNVDDCQKTFEE